MTAEPEMTAAGSTEATGAQGAAAAPAPAFDKATVGVAISKLISASAGNGRTA
jgi:hypothetical protein